MEEIIALEHKIFVLRSKKRLTQKELADKLFLSHQQISQWETGSSYPTNEHLKRLEKIFEEDLSVYVRVTITQWELDKMKKKA